MATEDQTTNNGLVCAYTLDGKGSGIPLAWDQLDEAIETGTSRWIHMDFTHPQTQRWLYYNSGVDETIADALLDDDSRPRTIEHRGGLLIILRGVNTNPGAEPEDMISIRIWLEKNRIITTRRRKLLSVKSIRENLAQNEGPTDAGSFITTLVYKLSERISPFIDELDETIEAQEDRFEKGQVTDYRGEFSAIRRQAVRIRRFLAPQRECLDQLSRQPSELLSDEERFQLREEADRVTRNLEDLDLVKERAMVAQEELIAKLAQEQNSRMYILAIVAAIFLPLSFLTGLMGMNVAGLPGTENPASFTLIMLAMIGTGAAIIALFRWKKWL